MTPAKDYIITAINKGVFASCQQYVNVFSEEKGHRCEWSRSSVFCQV